jgi:hypothetical protein
MHHSHTFKKHITVFQHVTHIDHIAINCEIALIHEQSITFVMQTYTTFLEQGCGRWLPKVSLRWGESVTVKMQATRG